MKLVLLFIAFGGRAGDRGPLDNPHESTAIGREATSNLELFGSHFGHSRSLPSHDEATFAPPLHVLYRSCFATRVGTTNHFDTQACDGDLGLDDMSDHLYWDTGYYLPASLQNG